MKYGVGHGDLFTKSFHNLFDPNEDICDFSSMIIRTKSKSQGGVGVPNRDTSSKNTSKGKKRPRKGAGRDIGVSNAVRRYLNQYIVVDTSSDFIFIGKLMEIDEYFVTLVDADVHDRRESPSMNEKYIMDSKTYGVRCNRRRVHIRLDTVISISVLEDVIEY